MEVPTKLRLPFYLWSEHKREGCGELFSYQGLNTCIVEFANREQAVVFASRMRLLAGDGDIITLID